MSILSNVSEVELQTQLEAEKESIIKFLAQYSYGNKLYVDDFQEFRKTGDISYEMITFMHSKPTEYDLTSDKWSPNYVQIYKSFTKYYLELIDNQWIIKTITDKYPIPLINYYGDVLPEHIRFENGISLCYLKSEPAGNFGW